MEVTTYCCYFSIFPILSSRSSSFIFSFSTPSFFVRFYTHILHSLQNRIVRQILFTAWFIRNSVLIRDSQIPLLYDYTNKRSSGFL